jgi:hypothetical protein
MTTETTRPLNPIFTADLLSGKVPASAHVSDDLVCALIQIRQSRRKHYYLQLRGTIDL